MSNLLDYPRRSKRGEPVWELATEYPIQGSWTEEQYLRLTDSRRGIEFNAGMLEFLPMPTRTHQEIIFLLCQLLKLAVVPVGDCWVAGIRVRTVADKIREPDVVAMLDRKDPRAGERTFDGADLVCEVVSDDPGADKRDYEEKRAEYEQAGIPEYWIVDPIKQIVTVLALRAGKYVQHSVARDGEVARSALIDSFAVESHKLFHRD